MARVYPRGDKGRWGRPTRQSQIEVRRWRQFTQTIDQRIDDVRATEGIDGRVDTWRTFDHPLPSGVLPARPVRLRLAPVPTQPRNPANGRLLARRAS